MDTLIEAVRKYPCLWNTTAIEYRDQELKDAAWAEVMKETELSSVKEVKLKWKKLRDSYRDALKRQSELMARDPAAGGKRPYPWKYMRSMQFLQPHMSMRKKPAESPPPAAGSGPAENGLSAHSHNGAAADHSDDESDSEDSPPPKRKRSSSRLAALERKLEAVWAQQASAGAGAGAGAGEGARPSAYRPRDPAPPDPLDIFFNGMCQATKRLPYPTQIKIKKTLFAAVIEAEEAYVAEQQSLATLWAAGRHASDSSDADSADSQRPA